jgi:phosphatidylinositol glycan class V
VAWWINTIAFIFAALALHELTYCVAKKYVVARELCVECAYTSALLFCFNPASVFFSAAYSESLFCMMTFSGYFFAERNNHFLAVTCWVMASYTRSNGSLVVAWVILQTIARCLQPFQTLDGILSDLLSLFYQSFFILAPIIYHDWNGYYIHCVEAQEGFQPQWCNDAHPMFGLNHYLKYLEADDLIIYVKTYSLYKHVQSRYWNVGFLNYYEWKQIPNFLLAFPVLFLGATGALTWIWQSWKLFRKNEKVSNGETGKWWHMVLQPTRWALFALRVSKAPVEEAIKTLREREQPEVILVGPTLLAYYAVLAAACLVGATIAHVQISTRFIFSSCPAIYWFMSYICISDSKDESRSIMKKLLLSRSAMVCYCVGFILAGVTMHVNWLPWT